MIDSGAGPRGFKIGGLPPGVGQALGAIVLWSSLATLTVFLERLPALFLVGISLLIGSCGGALVDLKGLRKDWRVKPKILLLGVYGLFGYHLVLFLAFRLAPPLEANLINELWPLLIVILSPLYFKEYPLTRRHFFAALLGLLGVCLIGLSQKKGSFEPGVGYALAFMAAVIWATYSLWTKKVEAFSSKAVGVFCLASGVLSLGAHFVFERWIAPTPVEWFGLVVMGLGPMGFAFYLWDEALKVGDPRAIGILAYLAPPLSTLFLVCFGKKEITGYATAALGLILMGAWIGAFGPSPSGESSKNKMALKRKVKENPTHNETKATEMP